MLFSFSVSNPLISTLARFLIAFMDGVILPRFCTEPIAFNPFANMFRLPDRLENLLASIFANLSKPFAILL